MFDMHLISGITDGWQGCESPAPPPVKLNLKTGPLPSLHLVFTILLVSVDCCFFAFFGVLSGDFEFLYSRSNTAFTIVSQLFSGCYPVGSRQPSLPLLKPLATLLHLIKARLCCR